MDKPNTPQEINRMLAAVVQEQDIDNATNALTRLGFPVNRLPSVGAFLGRRNATLLIGLQAGQEDLAVQSLSQSCRRRVEYVATPLEGSPLPFPSPTPIVVGGATIFVFDLDRYVEF
jgi:uncharacterized protein YaaQ